mgnify:CR=1 FL=1
MTQARAAAAWHCPCELRALLRLQGRRRQGQQQEGQEQQQERRPGHVQGVEGYEARQGQLERQQGLHLQRQRQRLDRR